MLEPTALRVTHTGVRPLPQHSGQKVHGFVGEDGVILSGPWGGDMRLSLTENYCTWPATATGRDNEANPYYTALLNSARAFATEAVRLKKVKRVALAVLAGEQFLHELHQVIGEDNLARVRALNREEDPRSGICHSHDFCDANMVMLAALEALGVDVLPEDHDGMPDDVVVLWNTAWSYARASLDLRGPSSRD